MTAFAYHDEAFYCEEVPIATIAREVGTPCYVYSHRLLVDGYRALDQAFAGLPHLICYAMKANANLAVLRTFIDEGGGIDIVSGGELFRALHAGADPRRIVFAGVGKGQEEIEAALQAGILLFNVESMPELEAIQAVAARIGRQARVALRVNPDVDPQTHPYISTGLRQSKFGVPIQEAPALYRHMRKLPNLDPVGVHAHIGSQITQVSPFYESLSKLVPLVEKLRQDGFDIRYFDIGGGLGIRYKDEAPPAPSAYAEALKPLLGGLDCTVLMEPGRLLVGNAGVLITKVLYVKANQDKKFLVVDGAMNDLIRPSLYNAYHAIVPAVRSANGQPEVTLDVVGPICESGDFLGKERPLPPCQPGDLLVVMSAGAYGFAMASNYNARPRAAEVMVRGDKFAVVRARETYDDLIRGECIPTWA
ncbi:MAG TPA: diaminopimelate decarboxylase [Alphaproteobacteria bacterium]|nr:diaminopimelate decarboxylase [Alphaproteobacteria bacterium]